MFWRFIVVECVDVTCPHDQADLERDFKLTESFTYLNKGLNLKKQKLVPQTFYSVFRRE